MSSAGGEAIGEQVAAAARGWLGTPFLWEASLRGVGADCRGLVAGVARDCGRPEGDALEARVGGYMRRIDSAALLAGLDRLFAPIEPTPEPRALPAGAVLAFRVRRRVQHLGIALGGDAGRIVHAWSLDPRQVIESPIAALAARGIHLAGAWTWRERAA